MRTKNHIDNCGKIANSPRFSVANCKICTSNTFADAGYNYHITVSYFSPSNIPYRIFTSQAYGDLQYSNLYFEILE